MKKYNFNAGPSMFPKEVLLEIQKDFLNWNNSGFSIIETSHRSSSFINYISEIIKDFREILNIPDNYEVLFCHGGARGQFSAIPMNFLNKFSKPEYIYSGYWSYEAYKEACLFCNPTLLDIRILKNNKMKSLLSIKKWKLSNNSSYVHYCPNETIEGITIFEEPIFHDKIFIGDFSSIILSKTINVKNFGMIYACAQKNIAPAGLTVLIIRKDLIKKQENPIPSILNYDLISKNQSIFNTPTIFSWYVSGLILKWIKKNGGIKKIEKINIKKSNLLYNYIKTTDFYKNNVCDSNKSNMNVVFNLENEKITLKFIKEAENYGLYGLKGHTILGGLRASIYNSMPIEGIKKLINFMKYFEKRYG